jgi:hypothetical protein
MRTAERLKWLKAWARKNLCEGRDMKAPASNMNIAEIVTQEPQCYVGWAPARMDSTGMLREDPYSVVPGIIIMPSPAYAKYTEEKRFDRYNNIHRPQEMGSHLAVSMLFSVYEPGVRLPGFVDSVGEGGQGLDMSLLMEGTEQGLFTLLEWMDDCKECLLRDRMIPHTDLSVEEETITYSLYTDQSYVVDRRPIYYGFVNVSFNGHADVGVNPDINKYLL